MCSRMLLLALIALLANPVGLAAEETPDPGATAEADEATGTSEREDAEDSGSTPKTEPDRYTGDDAPLLHGKLELSLEDAIRMGLENNLDVQVERYAPIIADHDVSIAWGSYDPTLFAEFGHLEAKTPTANVFASSGGGQIVGTSVSRETDGFAGLRGVLPILSTEYAAQFEGSRRTPSAFIDALNPELTSGWSLSVTQPLLRDLIWNQPWTQVRTSRILLESSGENFRTAVMNTVAAIEDAYWGLLATDEARKVAEKSLETAAALLDQTKTQYEVGVVSKVEVTEAQAGLSLREVALIRAENTYRNQQDVLIDLVLGPGLRAGSSLEIAPTDQPEEYLPYEVDVETAVEQAFQNRPELVAAAKEIERQRVQLSFARSQRLPELDGIFSFGQGGISGDFNPGACSVIDGDTPPPTPCTTQVVPDDFNDSFDDYEDNPTYTARARLTIPLPNTSARNTVSRTKLEMRRAKTQKRRLEQSIIIEVRRAARNLVASQEAIDAARDAEAAAEEQLRAERIRLEYGESTPFDVLQREEDLVDRENELITAFQGYRTSATALDRAQGTILRNRNIAIADVQTLR